MPEGAVNRRSISKPHPDVERLAYSLDEVRQAVPIGKTFLYELIATGKLRTVTLGKRRLVPADALRDLIDRGDAI